MDPSTQVDETTYRLLLTEFDALWARRPQPGAQIRMEQLLALIEAFEQRHRSAAPAAAPKT